MKLLLQMNRNLLVMVYTQVLRFFDVIKSDSNFLRKMANEELPSKMKFDHE